MEPCAACRKEAAFRCTVFWRNGVIRYRVKRQVTCEKKKNRNTNMIFKLETPILILIRKAYIDLLPYLLE